MAKKVWSFLKYFLSLALAAVLVYFAFRGVDWKVFLTDLKLTRWGYVGLYLAASVLALYFRMERWHSMLMPLDSAVLRWRCWHASNVGNLSSVVLPGSGELVRCGYVSSKQLGPDKVLGTMLCERAWDFVCIGLLIVLSLVLRGDLFGGFFRENIINPLLSKASSALPWVVLGILLLIVVVTFSLIFRFRTRNKVCARLAELIIGLWKGLGSFVHVRHKGLFALETIAIWLMYVLMCFFLFKAIPGLESLNMIDAVFVSSVGNIASTIPVPGGIGAYHYLVTLTLENLYGMSQETGILFATMNHELHALLVIVLGMFSSARISVKRRK